MAADMEASIFIMFNMHVDVCVHVCVYACVHVDSGGDTPTHSHPPPPQSAHLPPPQGGPPESVKIQ